MKITKIVVPSVLALALGIGVFSVQRVSAQEVANPHTSIIKKIATKFNLKEEEVKAVFDEEHETHKAEMKKRFEERLTQAVQDGKLTEEKKQLILAKHDELMAQKPVVLIEGDTPSHEEMKKNMEAKRQELEAWAKENDIDMSYLFIKFGRPMRGFHKAL